jgi:hypothetical protein
MEDRDKPEKEVVDLLAEQISDSFGTDKYRKWYCKLIYEFGVDQIHEWLDKASYYRNPEKVFAVLGWQALERKKNEAK